MNTNMDERMLTVTIDDQEYQYPEGISYEAIAADFQHTKKQDIVLVTVNGKLRELHHRLKKNCRISFLTT